MYSGRFSRLVRSGSFSMFCCSLSWLSISYIFYVFDVNNMFWCCILHFFGYLVNYIVSKFQFTSGLCLTNQLYPKNMSILFKFVTVVLIYSLYPLISSFSSTNYVISPFLGTSILKTLNDLFIGFVLVLSFFTSYLSISV